MRARTRGHSATGARARARARVRALGEMQASDRFNINSQLEHLQSKYVGTGHADLTYLYVDAHTHTLGACARAGCGGARAHCFFGAGVSVRARARVPRATGAAALTPSSVRPAPVRTRNPSEWCSNVHRDSLCSFVGRHSTLSYLALAEGEERRAPRLITRASSRAGAWPHGCARRYESAR